MLIDTHCHLNMCVKTDFDVEMSKSELLLAGEFVTCAREVGVSKILNVGTSLIESRNCIQLATTSPYLWAAVGIHPNDCTPAWRSDIEALVPYLERAQQHRIVAIGECGLDKHYPGYDLDRQRDAFMRQIELAHQYDLALVVHTRDAGDETLRVLEQVRNQLRGVIHCFSEDDSFADTAIAWGFALGIGGTITYPKNNQLRETVKRVGLAHIVLETDSPFLPPQALRGTKNTPANIPTIAQAIAELCSVTPADVATATSANAERIFRF